MECIMRGAVSGSVVVILLVISSTGDLGGQMWPKPELWLNCQLVYFPSNALI